MENMTFNREKMLGQIESQKIWDILIIGGGATGLGAALDAASRGYSTLLLEQHDFAKGTSSRSTKLVHGGVRYLAQGNIKLVYRALHERGILLQNAPHVVKPLSFIIPCYTQWNKLKYTAGLKFYDLLAGKHSFGSSTSLPANEVKNHFPNINSDKLKGGVQYFDGQFDDARLAINIAQTAAEHDAVLLNYFKVTGLTKQAGKINGITGTDLQTGGNYTIIARSVINATGIFVDDILQMDNAEKKPVVTTSQGVHIVIDKYFLESGSALMIPETSDGRVLFAVPWHGHVIIGTTDNLLKQQDPLEPKALESEIQFLLDGVKRFLIRSPSRKDVLSVFAGLRPLAASSDHRKTTKEISRDHKLILSKSGLTTITGGKWTTYRKMAEETINLSAAASGLPLKRCITEGIRIHGWVERYTDSIYGADEEKINQMITNEPTLASILVNGHGYREAEVVWAVRNEMAVTVEDVLARRLRLLFLDARAAVSAAPKVASIMMKELHLTEDWKQQQLEAFNKLAANYILN